MAADQETDGHRNTPLRGGVSVSYVRPPLRSGSDSGRTCPRPVSVSGVLHGVPALGQTIQVFKPSWITVTALRSVRWAKARPSAFRIVSGF
jgi:hypothetical protein